MKAIKKMTVKQFVRKQKSVLKKTTDRTTGIYILGMLYGIKRAVEMVKDGLE